MLLSGPTGPAMNDVWTELCRRLDLPLPTVNKRAAVLIAFAAASRRAGRKPLVLTADAVALLESSGVNWPLAERTDDLWRIALLAIAAGDPDFTGLVGDCFRAGDNEE